MVRRRPPARTDSPGQLGAGRRPGHPAVDGAPPGPVQQRLRQQPVPRPAAVLQMAGRRRRATRPDGQAAAHALTCKLVPVFTGEELTRLDQACTGRTFTQRRDTAIIAVFRATGIRLAELVGLRYDPGDPRCSDIDLWQREITKRRSVTQSSIRVVQARRRGSSRATSPAGRWRTGSRVPCRRPSRDRPRRRRCSRW